MSTMKIRRIGNSLGAIFPAELLTQLHVGDGDVLYATEDGKGGMNITPYDPDFAEAMEVFERGRRKYRNALRKLAE